MIITIADVKLLEYQGKATGRQVTEKSGKTHNIKKGKKGSDLQENFEEKWVWLDGNTGKAIDLEMGTFTDKDGVGHPFVADFSVVADNLAPETTPVVPPEHKDAEKSTPSGQETGMWFKELGECLRSGYISKTDPLYSAARTAYFAQMFSILNIEVEK